MKGKKGKKNMVHPLLSATEIPYIDMLDNLLHDVREKFGGGVKFLGIGARYGFAELTLVHKGEG